MGEYPERQGHLPDRHALRAPTAKEARYKMTEIDNLLERAALNFLPHREVLDDVPPKSRQDSLQVYFW